MGATSTSGLAVTLGTSKQHFLAFGTFCRLDISSKDQQHPAHAQCGARNNIGRVVNLKVKS